MEYVPAMYATFWALIPPVVAIVLALITKEVYSSLFVGILVGGLFYSGFSFEEPSFISLRMESLECCLTATMLVSLCS